MMKKIYTILLLCALSIATHAQISGVVVDDQGEVLAGANVWWMGTTVGTATDMDGAFTLPITKGTNKLVTSYMGYHNDTTEVRGHQQVTIVLVSNIELDEVTISERKMAVLRSRVSPLDVTTLTGQELCKAACCNLSESFETSASVDVAYADAATGAKQIKLLGLSGTYVQLLTENTPNVRGLAQSFGMEYIPGPWMDAIQVSKGTSSVINGYEAITGQINVEYLKPQTTNPIAINAMLSRELHAELNLTGGWDIDDKCSTALLVHAQDGSMEMDDNGDGILDMPKNHQLNLLNRWYIKDGDYTGQVLVRALYDQRVGGQSREASQYMQSQSLTPYQIDLRTRRIDGFMKNGYVFDPDLGTSIGIIAAASYHDQSNRYGETNWNAAQTNAYLNAIFQTNFENEKLDPFDLHEHKLSAGVSLNADIYKETLERENSMLLNRHELTPGVFAEYTYSYLDKVTLLLGVREDWSSHYGFFCTPRMNLRYAPFHWWTIRTSVGMGYRSPNLVADNAAFLSSKRTMYMGHNTLMPNMLQPFTTQEQTVNSGATMTFYIPIASRELQVSAEYYYTHFLDGVIADMDHDAGAVYFLNMKENANLKQMAHNMQVEASMEVMRGWTWTLAFRYTDTRMSSWNVATEQYLLREKPLQNRFKGIITTSYQTPLKKWQFDVTAQFNGPGRMPDGFVDMNNGQYYSKDGQWYHTWYPQLMAQITKNFRTASIYLGAENMTNFTQKNPILGEKVTGSEYVNPRSINYDATQIWGPIHGWKLYLGFRWWLDRPDED